MTIARRLVSLNLVEAGNEHSVSEAFREDIHTLLTDLANLPGQVVDPDWLQEIDGDLREQVDGAGPREPRMTPVEARAQAAKAKIRRERKAETQRQRRAEGRA